MSQLGTWSDSVAFGMQAIHSVFVALASVIYDMNYSIRGLFYQHMQKNNGFLETVLINFCKRYQRWETNETCLFFISVLLFFCMSLRSFFKDPFLYSNVIKYFFFLLLNDWS